MSRFKLNRQSGLVQLIVILVIVLIVLGYFGFNLPAIIQSPGVQTNLHYAWDLAVLAWNNVIIGGIDFVWNHVVMGLLWHNIVAGIDKLESSHSSAITPGSFSVSP